MHGQGTANVTKMGIKAKLCALALLLLVCAATANSQDPAPFLGKSVTGVNATSDVTQNVSLDRGFVLSGRILGGSSVTAESVTAVSMTTGSFSANISQATHRYRIDLPAGTYNLNIVFLQTSATLTTLFAYTDSTAITVSTVDVVHDITLPTVTTSLVTGAISNLLAIAPSKSVGFSSTSISGFTEVLANSGLDTGGNYSVQLPNGTFTAGLSQELLSSTGSVTTISTTLSSSTAVSGPATVNFTAPTINTADLTGTVTITGSSTIPANSSLAAGDQTNPKPSTTSFGFGLLPGTGMYDLLLGTAETYGLLMDIPVVLLPSPAPTGNWTPPDPSPLTSPLTTPTVHNITLPMLPANASGHTISGRVTATSSGAPLPGVSVIAGSSALSVAPNTSFERIATTDSNGNYSVTVAAGTYNLSFGSPPPALDDFDGDGSANIAVWRPAAGTWFIISNAVTPASALPGPSPASSGLPTLNSTNFKLPSLSPTGSKIASANANSVIVQQWGTQGDIPVPGDYDGDRKTDVAVFRPSTGTWFIIPSSNPGSPIVQQWGASGDIPVPGDYDGDGKTDIAIFRPSSGTWFIIPSSNPGSPIVRQWGASGDIPVPGDYDGDGKTDIAIFRPSAGTWFIIPSSNPGAIIAQQWGASGDIPVPGDYDGDGKADFGVFRPSAGTWFIIPSSNPGTIIAQQWGASGDIPVPADYDGDQVTDIAIFRPSAGTWFIIPSSAPTTFTATQWGANGDVPIPKPIGGQ